MAQMSFTIPDSILARVINGVAYQNGYQDQVPDANGNLVANPYSKTQFAKDCLKAYVKNCVVSWEANQAAETARVAAVSAGTSDIVLGN